MKSALKNKPPGSKYVVPAASVLMGLQCPVTAAYQVMRQGSVTRFTLRWRFVLPEPGQLVSRALTR